MRKAKYKKPHEHFNKKNLFLILIGVILFVSVFLYVGMENVLPLLSSLSPLHLAIILGLQFLVFGFWAIEWTIIVNKFTRINLRKTLPIFLVGRLVNNLTPGPSIGGEPVMAYYLSKTCDKNWSTCFATVVMDLTVNFAAYISIIIFSIVYVLVYIPAPALIYFIGVCLTLLLVFSVSVSILFYKRNSKKIEKGYEWFLKKLYGWKLLSKSMSKFKKYEDLQKYVVEQFENFKTTLLDILKYKRLLGVSLVFGFLFYFTEFVKTYFIFNVLGYSINFSYVVVVITLSSMVGYVIFIPGGTGAVEASMVAMYVALGVDVGVAAAVTLLSRIAFYLVVYGIGYSSLLYVNFMTTKKH